MKPAVASGRGRSAITLAVALMIAGCQSERTLPGIAIGELATLSHPELSAAEPSARAQIEEQRATLAAALAADEPDTRKIAQEMGRMANLYHAYGLFTPALTAYENAAGLDPRSFDWAYGSGLARERSGDLEGAALDFRKALSRVGEARQIERGLAQLRLGRALFELDRVDEARSALVEAAGVQQLAAAAESALGRVALREGRADDAIGHFERALELEPDAGALHHRLALAHRQGGDLEAAARHLQAVSRGDVLFPDPVAAAIDQLAKTAGALSRRGGRELVNQRPEKAIEAYRAAVEADPDQAEARRSLAQALVAAGQVDAAVQELETARKLEPDNLWVLFDLGNALQASNRNRRAIEVFRQAIARAPEMKSARFNLANVLIRERLWNQAIQELDGLLELDPGNGRARYQRAMALARIGRGGEAVALLRELLAVEPQHREARRGLADLLRQQGQAAAAGEPRGLPKIDSTSREPWLGQALTLAQSGSHREARKVLEEGLLALPDDPALSSVLARLLATAPDAGVRDGTRAVALARRLYARHPSLNNAETLAMALAEVGDFAAAARVMSDLIEQVKAQGQGGHLPRLVAALERYRGGQPMRMQ